MRGYASARRLGGGIHRLRRDGRGIFGLRCEHELLKMRDRGILVPYGLPHHAGAEAQARFENRSVDAYALISETERVKLCEKRLNSHNHNVLAAFTGDVQPVLLRQARQILMDVGQSAPKKFKRQPRSCHL